jgi:lactam utilization protein B
MVEQMLRQETDEQRPDNLMQAIAKLKSMRIVTASADYYQQAEDLLTKNSRRFHADRDYCTDSQHGAFFTRKNRQGETIELIMLHEDCASNRLTIVNVTGDIDKEFLCFLYNNKSLKN